MPPLPNFRFARPPVTTMRDTTHDERDADDELATQALP